jgi:two-component system LytT family response regulator
VEQINELHPDIVFLDVQMPDLDGFGVIENVEPVNGSAPIYIFVTAYDVHAIRAFEVHAVDYLLKPYDKERFAKALVHARQVLEQRRKANRDLEPLLRYLRSLRPLERFVVKDNKRIFFVPVSNVLWIEAMGNYACIHTASDSHLLREALAHLEEKLAPHNFIRVRKSAIVNGACISEIRPMFDGVYDIVLTGGTVVTSSRRYAHKLRALLES